MRTMLLAVLLVGTAVAGGAAQEKKYTSKAGKFAVGFPAGQKVVTNQNTAKNGQKTSTFAVVVPGRTFVVMHADLPKEAQAAPPKTILEMSEKGMAGKGKGKVIESKELEPGVGGHPAREVLVDKDGSFTRTMLVIAAGRMYIVIVGGSKEFVNGKEATAFLDSFEVTK